MLEPLELRTLLNATLDGSGNLTVNGSSDADTILLALSGANIAVTIQPENFSQSFPVASVNAIFVNCGDDNDTATIDNGITKPGTIMGETGSDTLTGGGGNELIVAGDGNDTMDGRGGADAFVGEGGLDTLTYASRTAPLSLFMNNLDDDGAAGEGDAIDGSVDVLIAGSGNDRMNAAAENGTKFFYGMNGNDTLVGGSNDDRLNGGQGNDDLRGFDGLDILIGGPGGDKYNGGNGIDHVTFYNRTRNLSISLDDRTNDGEAGEADNVKSDIESVLGGEGNDVMTGSAGDNQLAGLGGNDTINGLAGNDNMLGGLGNDTFIANDGEADDINGGDGTDVATLIDAGLDTVTNVP